jgi:hypothetical protein
METQTRPGGGQQHNSASFFLELQVLLRLVPFLHIYLQTVALGVLLPSTALLCYERRRLFRGTAY